MSKINIVSTAATVIGVVIAGITLYETVYNKKEAPLIQSTLEETRITEVQKNSTENSVDILSSDCEDKYILVDKSINMQSLDYKKDEGYEKAIGSAIADKCFDYAYIFTEKISLGYKRDEYHEKIYLSAIEAKDYSVAKRSIDKLSLGYKRDEGFEALSDVIVAQ